MSILCIYHGNCADGFGAAWVVRDALGADNVEFYAGVHQDPPPDVTGRDVLMVDFAYKRPVLEQMAEQARSIVIIDHHKSAAEDLEPFIVEICGGARPSWQDVPGMLRDLAELKAQPIVAVFDMERSGAGLTWDVFHPGSSRPRLIDHIEDRDLWRFALDGTREIQAAVFSYPYDFDIWDRLILKTDTEDLRLEGEAIERKHFKDIYELLRVVTRFFWIGGYRVPIANLPYTLTSDAGHILAHDYPFGGCYWDTPEGRVFSLRSKEGIDVSEIARRYGGGGHRNAAGFRVPFDQLQQFEEVPQ